MRSKIWLTDATGKPLAQVNTQDHLHQVSVGILVPLSRQGRSSPAQPAP